MSSKVVRIVKKAAKITGISIASLLLILFLLSYILPNTIFKKIKVLVNQSIDGEINFSHAKLSFFNHFPALTLTLEDFSLRNKEIYTEDTLLNAREIAFGIDIAALIGGDIKVDQFFISDAHIHVRVNEAGDANYNVYKSSVDESGVSSSSGNDTTASLKLEKLVIENTSVVYDDRSAGIAIKANRLNYSGKGDLSKAIFDLSSHILIDSLDVYYEGEPYVLRKKIDADLITQVNTNSLALLFEKNKVLINRLPIEFTGKFNFLSRGYEMDFQLKSEDARLRSVFTVLPPSYNGWLKKTKLKGNADLMASIAGRYIAGTDTMPSVKFNMQVREGSIAYEGTPSSVDNLYLDLDLQLPFLNTDSLAVNIDSVFFNIDKDHFSSVFSMKGFDAPYIFTRTNCSIELEKLDKALGLEQLDVKGKLDLQLNAEGQYVKMQNPRRIRKDMVVTSIPSFDLRASLKNGYLRYAELPQAIQQINFNLNASCSDNNWHHTSAAIENIDIAALNNYIKGFIRLKNADDFPVEAGIDAVVRLSDIKQFYPLDSMDINGNLTVKLTSSGNYQPQKKMFPRTEALLKVENASVQTKYYPAPVKEIHIDAIVQNKEGTLYDLAVHVKPISFEFEGKPFMLKVDLRNFDNIDYHIESKGDIDIGKLYRVFAQEGYDINGVVQTDLLLKGNQADAAAGRYSRLNNSGTLKLKDITLNTDLYPLPFHITKGSFVFQQDNMKLEEFSATYGSSSFNLSGAISNVFNYIVGHSPLKGGLKLGSGYISLDELMAYQSDSVSARPDSLVPGSSGVIMVPEDVDVKFTADIKNMEYRTLHFNDVKAQVQVKDGEFKMNQAGFTVAGATAAMDATYKTPSPAKALFSYHVVANDFDVKRMYDEVELFRQMVPAAAKAQGIISLDYKLEGKLNSDMYPVLSSLKGGGVLSVKKVKVMGLKLFSAMGRATGRDSISNPDMSKVNFKTSIHNNIITLERTKIKTAGFRIRLQGQASLDGELRLKCRLGLPPLGIIGIPITITGTSDDPKIKLGKEEELPLEEQEEEMTDVDD